MGAGINLTSSGNLNEALGYFRSALLVSDNEFNANVTLGCLARCLHETGDFTSALSIHQTVLAYYTSIQYSNGRSEACNNIALTLISLDEYAEALRYTEEDLKLCTSRGDKVGETEARRLVGSIQMSLKMLDKAEATLRTVVEQAEALGRPVEIAHAYSTLGRTLLEQEKDGVALPFFERAVAIYNKHCMYGEMAKALSGLVQVYKSQENWKLADETLVKQIQILRDRGYNSHCCVANANLAMLRLEGVNPRSALGPLQECTQIALQCKNINSDCIRVAKAAIKLATEVLTDPSWVGVSQLNELKVELEKDLD